jgi:hypothetical protein
MQYLLRHIVLIKAYVLNLHNVPVWNLLIICSTDRIYTSISMYIYICHILYLFWEPRYFRHWEAYHHRFNYEINLQSFFGLHVHSCTHWPRTATSSPFPPHLDSNTRALLVSQYRRHLLVTPCLPLFCVLFCIDDIKCLLNVWRKFSVQNLS